MSAATAESAEERVRRLARELAETVKQSLQPREVMRTFVAVMADEHLLDMRAATGLDGRGEADPVARDYLDRTRGQFTRADADALAEAVRDALVTPGAIVWDDEVDVLAGLRTIERGSDSKMGEPS